MTGGVWIDLLLVAVLVATGVVLYRQRATSAALAEGGSEGGGQRYLSALTRQAGFDPAASRWFYWLAKAAFTVALPLLFLEVFPGAGARPPVFGLGVLAVFGFFVPDLWLLLKRRDRRRKIRLDLSYFLDLLVALLHSGLSLEEAFRRAGRTGFPGFHPLSREVALVAAELDAGKERSDAFYALAERTGVSELRAVAAALKIATRHGTSIEQALETQADLLRTKRRENARRQVTVAATKAVFPLFLCGFPVFFVLVLFPTILEMVEALRALAGLL